jgi:hypothetical protein
MTLRALFDGNASCIDSFDAHADAWHIITSSTLSNLNRTRHIYNTTSLHTKYRWGTVHAEASNITCSHVCDRSVTISFPARLAAYADGDLHEACQAILSLPMTSMPTIRSSPNHTWIQTSPHRARELGGGFFRALTANEPPQSRPSFCANTSTHTWEGINGEARPYFA